MSSYTRVLSALYVSAFIVLAGFTPSRSTFAVATPFPLPITMANNAHTSPLKYEAGPHPQDTKSNNLTSGYDSRALPLSYDTSLYERDLLDIVSFSKSAGTHADDLKRCADSPDKSSEFRSQCTSSLSSFESDIQLFSGSLSDKGLGYYDRNNDVETVVKDVINYVKDILGYTTCLVSNDPLLGPPLGSLIYEIKCIVEDILDFTEDSVDATINSLAPLLQKLLGCFPPPCKVGLAGLCL